MAMLENGMVEMSGCVYSRKGHQRLVSAPCNSVLGCKRALEKKG